MSDCPHASALDRLVSGQLSEAELPVLEAHVEACPSCQGILEELTAAPAFVRGQEGTGGSPELDRLIEKRPRVIDGEAPYRVKSPALVAPVPVLPAIVGFEVVREVGRGGMGVVYEAVELALGRRVALKVLSQTAADPMGAARFRREVRAAGGLHHTNIVPIFGAGQDGATLYYAMQLIEGESLDSMIRRLRRERARTAALGSAPGASVHKPRSAKIDEPPPTSRTINQSDVLATSSGASSLAHARAVARIGRQVADALRYAHDSGFLHRDIKPSNILLDAAGTAWVTDFGLAKGLGSDEALTHTGDIVGTLRYMPPERFDGRSEARGDVYALGVTLYELLTLWPVFDDPDRTRLVEHVLTAEPISPRQLNRHIPRDLETIVLKAMAKEPAARYSSAGAMAEDLRRYLDGESISARRAGFWERSARWGRRRPVLAALCAAVMLLCASLMGLGGWSYLRISQSLEEESLARARADVARAIEADTRAQSERLSANLALERGIALAEERQVGPGLRWMLRGLELAPASAQDLRSAARMSLGAWLEQAVVPKLMVATGGPIDCITVSPDRRTVVTGHNDGVLRSWDTTSGRPLGSVQAHEGAVFFLSFCPGRDVVASIGTRLDPTTRLWDARSLSPAGNPIRHRASGQTRAFFTFRRDGGILATYSPDDGAVRTWVVSTCLPFGPLISHPGVISAVFSPDGTRLATAGRDRFVRFWDIATGTALGEPLAHSSIVQGVAFSPDSRLLATIDGDDHELSQGEKRNSSLRIWEVAKGRRVAAADPGPPRPTVVAFHPTGRTIVLGGVNRPVQIYDAETATPVGPPLVHSDGAHEIAFSPDGRMIMSSSEDSGTRLIDANTGRPIGSVVEHGDRVVGAVFSPDSLSILTATQNGWLRTWDDSGVVSSGRPFPHPFGVQTAEFSPDGRIVATAGFDGTARLFDLDTRQPVGPPLIHSTRVRAARFRPDGQVLATGGDDDTVRLWDVATGRPIGQPLPHGDWVLNLRFSPDGQRLLVGRVAAQAKLWNLSAKPPRGTVLQHPDRVRGFEVWNVEFTRDGRVAITGDNGGTLAFWDAETGQRLGEAIKVAHGIDQILQARTGQNFFVLASGRIYTLDCEKRRITSPPFGDQITTIALSPDGKTLLAGRSDKNAQLWNPTTGREIGPRMRHDRAVRGVTFSPDGALLATVTIEGKARLWDASTGKPIGPPLEHPGWITRWGWDNRQPLAFAPDGRTLVTAGNHAVLWPVPAAMTADVARLATAISALVGLRFDATGGLQRLEPSEWSLELGALADALDARQEPLALHDRIAASCEQFGPPASALWHLDVLIADKPGDWTLHARRARIRSQLGDLTGAAADEARAITLGPSERIHSWRSHWLQDRAAEAEARRQWPEAVAHLNGLADLIGENAGLRFRRGEAHAQLGNWAAAASDLAAAIEPSSPFSESFGRIFRRRLGSGGVTSERLRPERLILYQLASGDSEAYRASCSSLRRHVRPGSDPRLDLFLVYLLTLGPDGAVDPSLSVRLAEAALRALTKGDALWAERYLGSALYRAGRYDEAVRRLEPNAKAGGPWDWAFLAMSHHHLGQDTEARRWLDRLRTRARSTGPHALLDDLEFDLLRREAETVVLLDPAFPTNPLAEPPPGYDSRQSGSGSLGSKTR